jgi:hypothetical protein
VKKPAQPFDGISFALIPISNPIQKYKGGRFMVMTFAAIFRPADVKREDTVPALITAN